LGIHFSQADKLALGGLQGSSTIDALMTRTRAEGWTVGITVAQVDLARADEGRLHRQHLNLSFLNTASRPTEYRILA